MSRAQVWARVPSPRPPRGERERGQKGRGPAADPSRLPSLVPPAAPFPQPGYGPNPRSRAAASTRCRERQRRDATEAPPGVGKEEDAPWLGVPARRPCREPQPRTAQLQCLGLCPRRSSVTRKGEEGTRPGPGCCGGALRRAALLPGCSQPRALPLLPAAGPRAALDSRPGCRPGWRQGRGLEGGWRWGGAGTFSPASP